MCVVTMSAKTRSMPLTGVPPVGVPKANSSGGAFDSEADVVPYRAVVDETRLYGIGRPPSRWYAEGNLSTPTSTIGAARTRERKVGLAPEYAKSGLCSALAKATSVDRAERTGSTGESVDWNTDASRVMP